MKHQHTKKQLEKAAKKKKAELAKKLSNNKKKSSSGSSIVKKKPINYIHSGLEVSMGGWISNLPGKMKEIIEDKGISLRVIYV